MGTRTISKMASIAILMSIASTYAQGPLTPPSVPAPTMKTLDQVEPRSPITSLPFTISQSGSYYLTSSLTWTGGAASAISVEADHVSIDLMGFTITSAEDAPIACIQAGERKGLTVQNGQFVKCGQPVSGGSVTTLRNLKTFGSTVNGLMVWDNSLVENCVVISNVSDSGTIGISAGPKSIIRGCVVDGCHVGEDPLTFAWGILAYESHIEDCSVAHVDTYGIVARNSRIKRCTVATVGNYGISAENSTIAHCTITNAVKYGLSVNQSIVSDCIVSGGSGCEVGVELQSDCVLSRGVVTWWEADGVQISGHGNRVADCQINHNQLGRGIRVNGHDNDLRGNVCSDNIGGPGIYVEGDRNRIEGNHLTKNNWGIYLLDASPAPEDRAEKNIVRLNTAVQNDGSGNYYIGTSNYVAAIDTDGSFTNAHANFSF